MEQQIWHQHYDAGVPTALEYPAQTIDQFLQKTADTYPSRTALIFGGMAPLLGEQHRRITYRELNALADRFAAGLQQQGLQPGDRVALYMPNCPQFVIAYYGTLRAGGIVVPSNPLYVAREIEHQLNDAGARFVVTLSLLYSNVKDIRANTGVEQVIVANIKEYFPGLLKFLFTVAKEKQTGHAANLTGQANTRWFQDFLSAAPAQPRPVTRHIDELAVLMYTGGTTGVPKGAQLTHRNLVANAIQSATWLNRGNEPQVMLTALPLTHCYAMTICMNLSVFFGYTQILIPDPRNFEHLLNAINLHRPTLLPGVPTLYTRIINHPEVKAGKYDIQSINACISGAAGLPPEVQREFEQMTGGRLVEGYGLSEMSPVALANPMGSSGRSGFIGVPLPDTEVKLVDTVTEETEVGPNEPGILCLRGPQMMQGYWNMPEETERALRRHADGHVWLHTGDVAEMSDDGYFRLVDRKKEMILAAGGLNVYPRDIEDRLYEHEAVLEAAAIGVPIGSTDQRAKAFVVLKEGASVNEAELIEWCQAGLAKYKVPKYIEFKDELPKTMVGKILRRQLMEEEEQQQDSHPASATVTTEAVPQR